MNIDRLEEFVCLANKLNYHTAARQCYISQSALSKHIISLEQELGCSLFVRTHSGMKLTTQGELLLEYAKNILDTYHTCLDAISQSMVEKKSPIILGYLYEASHNILSEFYHQYHNKLEDLQLEIKRLPISDLRKQLDEGAVNLVIDMDIGYNDPTVYSKYPLYTDCYSVIVPATHPLSMRSSITTADLRGEKLIVPSYRTKKSHSRLIQVALGPKLRKEIEVHAVLSDPTEMPWYVNNGAGLGLTAGHAFHEINEPSLRRIPIDGEGLNFNVSVIWKTENNSPRLAHFIEMLAKMTQSETFASLLPDSATQIDRD